MLRGSWRIFFLLFMLLESLVVGLQDEEEDKHDPGLNRYVSVRQRGYRVL